MFYTVLSFLLCMYFYYILKLYPAQNPISISPWCAGVTEITYELTNFWRTGNPVIYMYLSWYLVRAYVRMFFALS